MLKGFPQQTKSSSLSRYWWIQVQEWNLQLALASSIHPHSHAYLFIWSSQLFFTSKLELKFSSKEGKILCILYHYSYNKYLYFLLGILQILNYLNNYLQGTKIYGKSYLLELDSNKSKIRFYSYLRRCCNQQI